MTALLPALEALREARLLVSDLTDEITRVEAPLRAQLDAAAGELRAARRAAEALESELSLAAQAAYQAADAARRAALLAGDEVPPVAVPGWCTVRHLPAVELIDLAALPRNYLTPANGAIKKDLATGQTVAGARLVFVPAFALRGEAT